MVHFVSPSTGPAYNWDNSFGPVPGSGRVWITCRRFDIDSYKYIETREDEKRPSGIARAVATVLELQKFMRGWEG